MSKAWPGWTKAAGARSLELNKVCRGRFGFPFITAVKGRRPAEILAALQARSNKLPKGKRVEPVRQVERTLLLRLKDRLGEA